MANSTILNANTIPLNQQMGSTPNMIDGLKSWFQAMTFVQIFKRTVNFQLEESQQQISFRGIIQPLSPRKLLLKPEGQRAWTWHELHSDPSLILQVDDVVTYLGVRTRVMARSDFKIYGYIYYELVQDWENFENANTDLV